MRLTATGDQVDRAQVTAWTTVEIVVPMWREILDGMVATVPADGEAPLRPFLDAGGGPDYSTRGPPAPNPQQE